MITQDTPKFVDVVAPNRFVTPEEGEDINFFKESYRSAELQYSPRSESRAMQETKKQYFKELKEANPQAIDTIEKYEKPKFKYQNFISNYNLTEDSEFFVDKLRHKKHSEMFDNGRIYKDQNGTIVANEERLNKYVSNHQDSLKDYWDFRQLTDGTPFDLNTLEARNVASVQNELIAINEKLSKAYGTIDHLGSAAGTIVHGLTQPEVIATFFTGGQSLGAGLAMNAAKSFGVEFAAAAVSEAIMQPKILEWRRKLYDPANSIEAYSTFDAVKGALFNSLGAGALRGIGSVGIDLRILQKYGKAKATKVDAFLYNREYGSKSWKEYNKGLIKKSFEDNTLVRDGVGDDLVDETVEVMATSPQGDIQSHVDNIEDAILNSQSGNRFVDDTQHKSIDSALTNDFITVSDSTGEVRLARVVDSDDTHLIIDNGEGDGVIIDRVTGESDTKGYAGGGEIEPITFDEPVNVNHTDVKKTLEAQHKEDELVSQYIATDEEMIHYERGFEETIKDIEKACK